MSRYDAERLHQLISNPARYTGSQRAKDILAAWNEYLPKFRKVMPVEYRRAIAELKATEVAGPPPRAAARGPPRRGPPPPRVAPRGGSPPRRRPPRRRGGAEFVLRRAPGPRFPPPPH